MGRVERANREAYRVWCGLVILVSGALSHGAAEHLYNLVADDYGHWIVAEGLTKMSWVTLGGLTALASVACFVSIPRRRSGIDSWLRVLLVAAGAAYALATVGYLFALMHW